MLTTYLFENPYPALILGVITAGFFAAAFNVTRKKGFLVGIGVVALAVASVFLLCHLVVTPREEVRMVLDEGVAAIKANDPQRVIDLLSPAISGDTAGTVRMAFRSAKFTGAKIANDEITINELTSPISAKADFMATVFFQGKSGEIFGDRYACRMTLSLEKQGKKWLITGYKHRELVGQNR